MRIVGRLAVCGVAGVLAVLAGGCTKDKTDDGTKQIVGGASAVAYGEAAAKYNANVENLKRLFGFVVVQIEYVDKKGERHKEQGEGRIQIIQPDHVALSVGKVGETFFWLGSDSQRLLVARLVEQAAGDVRGRA
ncbi:MAG: hypothetical protein QM783_14740 [Phycisphaerales bacterium]